MPVKPKQTTEEPILATHFNTAVEALRARRDRLGDLLCRHDCAQIESELKETRASLAYFESLQPIAQRLTLEYTVDEDEVTRFRFDDDETGERSGLAEYSDHSKRWHHWNAKPGEAVSMSLCELALDLEITARNGVQP